MQKIIWHECKNWNHWLSLAGTVIYMLMLIFFSLLFTDDRAYHSEGPDQVISDSELMIVTPLLILIPMLFGALYAGLTTIGIFYGERQQKTIFFLLAAPYSRLQIFVARFLFIVLATIVAQTVQVLAGFLVLFPYLSEGLRSDLAKQLPYYTYLIYLKHLINSISLIALLALPCQFLGQRFAGWLVMLVFLYSVIASGYWVFFSFIPEYSNEEIPIDEKYAPALNAFVLFGRYLFFQHFLFHLEGVSWPEFATVLLFSAVALVLAALRYIKRDYLS